MLTAPSITITSQFITATATRTMKKSFMTFFFVFVVVSTSNVILVSCDDSGLQDKCNSVITKLVECLSFASGKADEPSSGCCSTVADVRKDNPVCLCYTIRMAHASGSAVSSLGLQVDRLIQLPKACKLADTDVTNCPKLLNLSPSSPDYSIFSNSTKASGSTMATPSSAKSASAGTVRQIHSIGTFAVAAVSAILLSIS